MGLLSGREVENIIHTCLHGSGWIRIVQKSNELIEEIKVHTELQY